MKRSVVFFSLLMAFLPLFFTGCGEQGDNGQSSVSEQEKIASEGLAVEKPLLGLDKKPFLSPFSMALISGDLATLYSIDNKIIFTHGGKDIALDESQDTDKLWLTSAGKYVYAIWWVKFVRGEKNGKKDQILQGKTLYLRASDDYGKTFKPRVKINSEHGVLPQLAVANDDVGNVAVIYSDERYPGYEVYVNYSNDGGATWLDKDVRLDAMLPETTAAKISRFSALSPQIAYVGKTLVATWQQIDTLGGQKVLRYVSRSSVDHGKTWGGEVEIGRHETAEHYEVQSYSSGDVLVFMASAPEKGLEAFMTKDGQSWKSLGSAPGTEKHHAVSYFRSAANKDTIFISYVAVPESGKGPWRTELVRLNKQTGQWYPNIIRMDRSKEGDFYEKSSFQAIATLPSGAVGIVWEDYRNIIPAIYMDYSTDNGETWLPEAKPLTLVGITDDRSPVMFAGKDKFWILYSQTIPVLQKVVAVPTVQVVPVNAKTGPQFPEIPMGKQLTKGESEARLKQRAKDLWDNRVKNEAEKNWDYLDPTYRSQVDKYQWIAMQHRLQFTEYKIERLGVFKPYGAVEGKAKYTFALQVAKEGLIEPTIPKDAPFDMKWGWFYDDWYFIPEGVGDNRVQ